MPQRRTALTFAAGALAGAALAGLLFALFFTECDGMQERSAETISKDSPSSAAEAEDAGDSHRRRPPALSDRGVGGPCVFSGTVMDESGDPIAGALVGVRALDVPWIEADLSAEARTDESGAFTLPGLADDIPFQAWAFAPGMAVASVERPGCGARLDFVLEPGARLVILATSPEGVIAGGLAAQIAGDAIWPARAGVTDDGGRLEVDGLPAGRYAIWVGGGGHAALSASPVEIAAGEERTVELSLEPSPPALIGVEDGDGGAPIGNAVVLARPRSAPLLALVSSTDESGAARIDDMASAEHDLEVLAPGYLREDPVALSAGSTTVVRLRRGARVTGRVVTRDRAPVPGARLEVDEDLGLAKVAWAGGNQREILGRITKSAVAGFPLLRPDGRRALAGPATIALPDLEERARNADLVSPAHDSWRSREDGSFSLAGLPPGRVVIGASHPDLVLETPARLILAHGGVTDGIEVVLRPGATLRVRALGEGGYPLRDVLVTLFGPDEEVIAAASTGSDGFAELRGLPGRVRVEAELDGHVPAVARIELRGGRAGEVEITLPLADGVLPGRLTDQRGFGIGQALITARSLTRGLAHVLQQTSGPDGSFVFENVGRGDYHVTAEIDGQPVARVKVARAGHEVAMVAADGPAGLVNGSAPEFVTPEMVAVATGLGIHPGEHASDSERDPGVIALTETLDQDSRRTEYGFVDQLPVTGPVPGKGGLPIEIAGGAGNVRVKSVASGSRVAGAGLEAGSRIVSIDGKRIETVAQAKEAILGPIGSVVVIEVTQGGENVNIVVQRIRVR